MLELEREARMKWARGRAERGLNAEAPFSGDPFEEFLDEMRDGWNYLSEIKATGAIGDEVEYRARIMIYELWQMCQVARRG